MLREPVNPATRALARMLAQRYAHALHNADPVAAETVLSDALQASLQGTAICSQVIAPAMRWIGELWESDVISVADEHLATATTHHLLAKFHPALFPSPSRAGSATALVACVEGERHALGASMVADVLRSEGWRVLELGADVPTDSLTSALARHTPDLVALSAPTASSIPALEVALEHVSEICPRARVLLGGHGVPTHLREAHPWAAEVEEAIRLAGPAGQLTA